LCVFAFNKRERPVLLCELLCDGEPDPALRKEAEEFESVWTDYQGGDFSRALEGFKALCATHEKTLYSVFMRRCETYLKTPPEDGWDGVFTATEK